MVCVCVCVCLQLSLFPEFNTLSVIYGKLSFNFISQKVPYIITASATSRGAGKCVRFNKDVGLRVIGSLFLLQVSTENKLTMCDGCTKQLTLFKNAR